MSRTRWVAVNILGVLIGYGAGLVTMQALTLLVDTIDPPEMMSGIAVGWSLTLLPVLATLGGAAGAAAGYALRQRLSRRQFAARSAARYALVGAVCWPILGALHLETGAQLIAPVHHSLFPLWPGQVVSDLLFWLEFVLSAILMSLPVGLAIAILTRKEAGRPPAS